MAPKQLPLDEPQPQHHYTPAFFRRWARDVRKRTGSSNSICGFAGSLERKARQLEARDD